jgi:16S rRNA (guanine527-N7)-methyltransferase
MLTSHRKKSKQNFSPRSTKQPVHATKLQPSLASLKVWFQKSRLSLSEQQYKQLWTFHQMLRANNAEYDLTRIYQFDNMVQKHYIDCILIVKYLQSKLPSPLLDIGSGAGFPGIPLKIACPKTEFILAEGRHKRVQFLTEVVAALDLKKVEIYAGKIYTSFNRPMQGVITRAVESMALTLARVQKCLVAGGKAIFMKGPKCDQEITEALNQFRNEYRLIQNTRYFIPHSPHQRRLVIFERQ